ncbi:hypothetical protein ACFX1R_022982 [Malus domestica]
MLHQNCPTRQDHNLRRETWTVTISPIQMGLLVRKRQNSSPEICPNGLADLHKCPRCTSDLVDLKNCLSEPADLQNTHKNGSGTGFSPNGLDEHGTDYNPPSPTLQVLVHDQTDTLEISTNSENIQPIYVLPSR